jgi:hypothetical protein
VAAFGIVADGSADQYFFEAISKQVRQIEQHRRVKEAHACPARNSGLAARAGQIALMLLLARCAGVHVDFHAHRHFDNLWSLPGHYESPK